MTGVVVDEVRVLEGPNLYFPRPAIKVALTLPGYLALEPSAMGAVCRAAGLSRAQSGAPGSAQRQRVVLRLLEAVTRSLARACGVRRLGVRVRPGRAVDEVVVAFVWRTRGRAEAVGQAIAPVLTALLEGVSLEDAVAAQVPTALAAPPGAGPRVVTPRVPVISITGTNGKTTTTRLVAHIGMTAGRRTAWSSTDGVVVQGVMTEPGDYSGPAGARAVLETPGVQLGVLETARGGMLLKGMGVTHNDVALVTNVSADHLGLQGIDTVDQLAEVKAIITKVTRPRGWAVLNGEDPRVWAMRTGTRARPWVFTMESNSPAVREALGAGGRAMTILDDYVTVLAADAPPDRLLPLVDVPMTLSGLSRHNIANALAGAAGALAVGLPREAVIEGLRTFQPDDVLNPGRMNTYTIPTERGEVTAIVDLAHNEAGLEALLDVARGLVAPGGRVHLGLGTAGDRSDEILQALGEIAGARADAVVIAHKTRYLRGRTMAEMEQQLGIGLARLGVAEVPSVETELEGLQACVAAAEDGDVAAIMCHADRELIAEWIHSVGGTPDRAKDIRRKVIRARGEHPAEAEIAALWELTDADERVRVAQALYRGSPGDARVSYEYAGTYDSRGDEALAVPLYLEALAVGLREPWRHRCRLQLASTLRNLGRLDEAREHVDAAVAEVPDSLGAQAFRALILHDAGEPTAALRGLLQAIAGTSTDTDVARYRRALTAYAESLGDPRG